MPLTHKRYGKSRVRVLRLARDTDRHAVRELTLQVMLEGGFDASFTEGDNRTIIATDTIKNIVNVLAHDNIGADNESFAGTVAAFLLARYPHVEQADVRAVETRWRRLAPEGTPHAHGFVLDGNGSPFAQVVATRGAVTTRSGLEGFTFMKTTQSGWRDFHRDEFRTLPDTEDRILATSMDATWTWDRAPVAYEAANDRVLEVMLATFLDGYSHGVQDSMFRMGEAALAAVPELREIHLALPNKHYIGIDLSPFGRKNDGTVFLPTDDPHGQIEATIGRS